MNEYKEFNDMFDNYNQEDYKNINGDKDSNYLYSNKSIEDITNDLIKSFVKEYKNTLLKEFSDSYVIFNKDIKEYKELKESIYLLKDKFNSFALDIYYYHNIINKNMKEEVYIKYANKKLNSLLKDKYLK